MTAAHLAAQVLLWAGVAAEAICCVGVWWMRDVFDRLHYAAAATSAGSDLIGVSLTTAAQAISLALVAAVPGPGRGLSAQVGPCRDAE